MLMKEFYKEFGKAFRKLNLHFDHNKDLGFFRVWSNGHCFCPITAVFAYKKNSLASMDEWPTCAEMLGLRYRDAQALVNVADTSLLYTSNRPKPQIKKLLEACKYGK